MQDNAVKIACCTTPNDRPFLEQLKNRLAPLRQTGEISLFIDIDISSMQAQNQWTLKPLEAAQVILFMISPEALATPFMTSANMQQLFQRHSNGLVRLIFILTQPALLKGSSFALLPTLPTNKQAISTWPDQEAAYSNITDGLLTHLQSLTGRNMAAGTRSQTETTAPGQEYIGTTPARSFDPTGYRAAERSYQAERYAEVSPEYGQESNNTQFDLWHNGEVIPPPPPGQEAFSEAGRQVFAEQERRSFIPYPEIQSSSTGSSFKSFISAILKSILYFTGVLIAEFGFICVPLFMGALVAGEATTTDSLLANVSATIVGLLIGPILLVILSVVFYRRRYHLATIPWYHYLLSLVLVTLGGLVALIVVYSLPGTVSAAGDYSVLSQTIASIFILAYGAALMAIAFRRTPFRLPGSRISVPIQNRPL